MKDSKELELNLIGMDSVRLTKKPQRYSKSTSPKPSNSDQLQLLTPESCRNLTSLLSDSLVKICRLLENEKDLKKVHEAAYFLKQCESFGLTDPSILSLKMLWDYFPKHRRGIFLKSVNGCLSFFEKLPTLGMTVNGKFLIQAGYYPKIESGYTLSDILEKTVDQKYFLSEKAIAGILNHWGAI